MARLKLASTALLVIMAVSSPRAEDAHLGLTEYELACMPCHGVDGRGDGPRAQSLTKPPADLTVIAKANGGIFPSKRVAEMIDGRATVAAHGPREMPIWGDRYRNAGSDDPAGTEKSARAQIRALVRYIERIQRP